MLALLMMMQTIVFANYDYVNPPREELENMIREVARDRGVPSVIVMALARVESVYRHFDEASRSVRRGSAGSIGLMQINNRLNIYDEYRLIYDIRYNIEAGIDVLLEKWNASATNYRWSYLPSVGNMDPNILENWYFALWGYNGFVASNNPNVAYAAGRRYTFQDLVYFVTENEYHQRINPIDISLLPLEGTPCSTLNVPTPKEYHLGDIFLAEEGHKVKVSFMGSTSTLNLRETPNGKIIGSLNDGEIYTIGDEAALQDGYYWYYLLDDQLKPLGWAARNWLIVVEEDKTDDKSLGDDQDIGSGFLDIIKHWARDYIEELFEAGIVAGKSNTAFHPNDQVTREEFAVMLNRGFHLGEASSVNFEDKNHVSKWAIEAVDKILFERVMELQDDLFDPKRPLTRIEAACAISRILPQPSTLEVFIFEDVNELTIDQFASLATVYSYQIIQGRSPEIFDPFATITRGEIAKILSIARQVVLDTELEIEAEI